MDLNDIVEWWHLQDQVHIVGNGHEAVQGSPANDGIEGEVDLRNVEDGALCAVVLRHPECHQDGDATVWDDGAWTHSQKRSRRSKLRHRNLQHLESRHTDKDEGCHTINQDVVYLVVGVLPLV
jgi:hypothetical protein